ncbi:hypothetical protein GOBAR_AA38825 [Gossypium barbadense]|uniref:Retrotransposon gag domain-containing protein n=1 Tax=Gossypium barbadense TaxID=3634 RepID=A0A2P5VSW1_GOSBA|nr:hypothetical protein GOBAR_AA38825 [Gossypium barbadense]
MGDNTDQELTNLLESEQPSMSVVGVIKNILQWLNHKVGEDMVMTGNVIDVEGRSKNSFSSRPVTRSYAKAHNNLVSEPAVMGDEKTLTAKLEAFMEQMATRQQALEKQVAMLSLSVQKTTKGDSEKNNEEQGSSGGKKRNSDSQHGGGMVPRYSKMEIPTYDGVGDPLGWLKRCEIFFGNQRTNKEDKVGLASFYLLREAQLWFDQIKEEEANLDWERFRELSYQVRATYETTDLKPRQQVNLFTAGLVEELRIDIEMQQPGNLGVAMNMARALERKQKVSSKMLSQTNLNWSTSQNTDSNSIIPTTQNIAKGGGQTIEPTGNNGKIEVPDIEGKQDDDEIDDFG